jgi:hypothetical protein
MVFQPFFYDFGLSLQIPSGNLHTNFWLILTFEVPTKIPFILILDLIG